VELGLKIGHSQAQQISAFRFQLSYFSFFFNAFKTFSAVIGKS
jgi:hypothetical protein